MLIWIVSTFCFFGAAFKSVEESISIDGPSMWVCIFGGRYTPFQGLDLAVKSSVGLIVLFVFQLIVVALSLIAIIGAFTKRIEKKNLILLAIIACVFSLTAVIMSFCTIPILSEGGSTEGVKLGSAPVSYSVLGIISLIACGTGIVLSKKEA